MHSILTATFSILLLMSRSISAGIIDPSCHPDAPECVCSMENAQIDLNRKFILLHHFELEEALKQYQCPFEGFERLPRSLFIDASQTPYINPDTGSFIRDEGFSRKRKFRYLRRRKRQVLVGVPTDEVFYGAVAQLNPRAFHQYAVLGSAAEFTCAGPNFDTLDEIDPRGRRFSWAHYNGAPITSAQSIMDPVSGMLAFRSVQLSDTGVYNCSIGYTQQDGHPGTKAFSHQLSVVSEPLFTLEFALRYSTDSCERSEKLLISDHLPLWIQQYICPACQIHNPSVQCVHGQYEASKEYEFALVISLASANFRFERASSSYEHLQSCSVSCSELYQVKLLEIVRDSAVKLFSLPIEVSMGGRAPPIIRYPIPQTLQMELLLGCLSGFRLDFKLCFPCDVGHFSPEGSAECFPCEIGSYQPLPGSSACISCENNYKTLGPGATSQSDCVYSLMADIAAIFMKYKYIFIGILVALVLLIIALVAIRCCCPTSSGLARCVNGYCCCCCPAKEKYGYEDDSPSRNSMSMTEFRPAHKSKKASASRDTQPKSKVKYKKIATSESEGSEFKFPKAPKAKIKTKSKKEDKSKRSAVASNIRYKQYTKSGDILLKKTAYDDDDDELRKMAKATGAQSKTKLKQLLSDSEDVGDTSVSSLTQKSPKFSSNKTKLDVNRNSPSPAKKTREHDPLALHRCTRPGCVPPTVSNAAVIQNQRSNLRPTGINTKGHIPKPPPLPNYTYN